MSVRVSALSPLYTPFRTYCKSIAKSSLNDGGLNDDSMVRFHGESFGFSNGPFWKWPSHFGARSMWFSGGLLKNTPIYTFIRIPGLIYIDWAITALSAVCLRPMDGAHTLIVPSEELLRVVWPFNFTIRHCEYHILAQRINESFLFARKRQTFRLWCKGTIK